MPIMVGIKERHKVIDVEIMDEHIVYSLRLDAAVGTGQTDFAHFLQHMEVLLVEYILV